jgi:hypothetical protein
MKHGLLLFFNHAFPRVRSYLEELYRGQFDEVHALTPPEDLLGSSSETVTYYYHSSFNFGAAFSELLSRPGVFCDVDWVTVLHDDVVLNPDHRRIIESKLAERPDFLAPPATRAETLPREWQWSSRMIGRAFLRRNNTLGDGNDGAVAEMAGLYARSTGMKAPATTFTFPPLDLLRPGSLGLVARKYWADYRSLKVDFGVPLWMGNSDFFLVRADRFGDFCRSSAVLTRCGLFAEVAAPTALRWRSERPAEFAPEDLEWVDNAEAPARFAIRKREDIPAYFEKHPRTLAIHPVKISRLI